VARSTLLTGTQDPRLPTQTAKDDGFSDGDRNGLEGRRRQGRMRRRRSLEKIERDDEIERLQLRVRLCDRSCCLPRESHWRFQHCGSGR
jgi:hypothetical protein